MKKFLLLLILQNILLISFAQPVDKYILLKPDRVFDGENFHEGWIVLIKNNRIQEAGPAGFQVPPNAQVIDLKGTTLLPGLIEGHSHLFLHPYNETSWDDQV